ncbi:MAG: bifunctional hexulose-6-phosphate synthase/ribonuclease regulator [Elusimicrobia bacterium CG03_land_8_20_14_0_80_50_18]|nr:MAG: bifunctional hexulose-6-phosphate synthase/ribonuclease regulator [Elusimicrobia bacterium CG03_land_8_20_14_0_80_50_18]
MAKLQIALDFVDLPRALKAARAAVKGGADILEAGTPLIKSCGLEAVRALRAEFKNIPIVADMKIMDTGRAEVEIAAKAGAGIVTVCSAAGLSTVQECVEAGLNYGAEIMLDFIGEEDYAEIEKFLALTVNYIGIHISIDEQMRGEKGGALLDKLVSVTSTPIVIAGGINSETAASYAARGAGTVIVGGAITKAKNPEEETRKIKKALQENTSIPSEYFVRVDEKNIKSVLGKVSAANMSDALHRALPLKGIKAVTPGKHMTGRALTVRTYPGDWAKPVEAIDRASKGDILVIDAGGGTPAVWGELATHSALQKGLGGIVIHGAVRDTADIKKMDLPVFSSDITPQAGEPKGFGEIGVPIVINGVRVKTGDWIIGDDDGVLVVPKEKAVEFTNRAMDVLERENRIREEIKEGSTLASVAQLLMWEKQK